MKWRKLFRTLHRDIGYTAAALTIAYAISGVAVNHIEDWNPSYAFDESAVDVGPLPTGSYEQMQHHVVAELGIDPATVKGHFMETELELRVFLTDGAEVRVDVRDGRGVMKSVATRPFLYEVNALHLNNIKGMWTWVADLFAIALLMLVTTGVFLLPGRQGIAGRGKWFLGAGFAVPAVFIGYMYYGA